MNATRAVRKSGFTQDELAAFLGMSRGHFNKKLHRRYGEFFTKAEINTLALHGVPVSELYPSAETVEVKS